MTEMTRSSARTLMLMGAMLFTACGAGGADALGAEGLESAGAYEAPAQRLSSDVGADEADDEADGAEEADEAEDTATGTAPGAGGNTRSGPQVGTNFWFLADWGENAWKSDVDFATTDDPWSPAFIEDLNEANYAVYRFMDWAGTNHSPIRNWSERTQKDSPDNFEQGGHRGRGIAYEWMFDLCNRMHTDCWINVPHLAIESYEADPSNNFFTELAKLAKKELDPTLNLYIEYSNETWNAGFGQYAYTGERGVKAGYATTPYEGQFKFNVYASTRMYEAFVSEYGEDIDRVKWVIAGHHANPFGTQLVVQALQDDEINPNHRMPSYYAVASYVGLEADGAAADIADQWRSSLAWVVDTAKEHVKALEGTGVKLAAYEGGQHILTNSDVFAKNPLAYDLYTEWLEQTTSIFAVTAAYAHSGHWKSDGAWGSKSYTGQPLSETPRARAMVDFINSR